MSNGRAKTMKPDLTANTTSQTPHHKRSGLARAPRNRFDRMEWAGAFGDLGTLIPFLVAYITLLKMDPFGVLFAFGVAKVVSGLYYRTPFPIQPMKAIGAISTTQAAQTLTITPNMVYGAGIATGLIWLVLGLTGATRRVASIVGRPVALGIILGLGFSFMLDGIRMMAEGWLLGGAALAMTLLLLKNRVLPVMFLLLVLGAVAACIENPALLAELRDTEMAFRLPAWSLGTMTWQDFALGAVFLAFTQVPLTLGNAIIAVTEENNQLFPDRPVTERKVSISTGIMNVLAPAVGGVPMCHGAGGMAGHVAFGARTGGSLIILGSLILAIALFFSGSVDTLFKMFPAPILGVILFLTGAQLAVGVNDGKSTPKEDALVLFGTAAFAMWNIGVAFVFGVAVYQMLRRGSLEM